MIVTRRTLLKAGGALAVAGAAGIGYGFGVEPMLRLAVTEYKLRPPNWPDGLKLRIVALADIHACEPFMSASRIASICDVANTLGGDVVVLLGDYVSGITRLDGTVPPEAWAASLARLKAPLGVHAVMGNHDWRQDQEALQGRGISFAHRALANVDIAVYENEVARLEKDGQPFWFAGLADQLAYSRDWSSGQEVDKGLDDLPGTLARITDGAPVILLAHEPDIFVSVPERVSITLAGHTHGGQIRILGYSPIAASAYGLRFNYGHIEEGGRHMIVSGGLGCTGLPVRIGSPPEIVVVELG